MPHCRTVMLAEVAQGPHGMQVGHDLLWALKGTPGLPTWDRNIMAYRCPMPGMHVLLV